MGQSTNCGGHSDCCDDCIDKNKKKGCGCGKKFKSCSDNDKCCPNRCATVVGLSKIGPTQAAPLIAFGVLSFYVDPTDGDFPGYSNIYQCNCVGVNISTPDDTEYIAIPCPGTYSVSVNTFYASDVIFGTAFLLIIVEINGVLVQRAVAWGTPPSVGGAFTVSFNRTNNKIRFFTLSTQVGVLNPEVGVIRITEPIGTEICYTSITATSSHRFLY